MLSRAAVTVALNDLDVWLWLGHCMLLSACYSCGAKIALRDKIVGSRQQQGIDNFAAMLHALGELVEQLIC